MMMPRDGRRITRRTLLSLAAASAFPINRLRGQGPIHPIGPKPPDISPSDVTGPVFEANSNLVPLDVQVLETATRHPIPDLQKEDFLVYDDGSPVPIAVFDDTPAPLNLLLLIDVSGGFRNEGILFTTLALRGLREQDDRFALMSFSDWEARPRCGFTSQEGRIQDAYAQIFRYDRDEGEPANTRLYDAIVSAATLFQEQPVRLHRPVIIVITHNREANSAADANFAIRRLLEPSITLEGITIPQEVFTPSHPTPQIALPFPVPGRSPFPRTPRRRIPRIPGIGRIPAIGRLVSPAANPQTNLGVANQWAPQGFPIPKRPQKTSSTPAPEQLLRGDLHSIEPIVEATGGIVTHLDYVNRLRGPVLPDGVDPSLGWDLNTVRDILDERLISRLRAQYTLGIYSSEPEPDRFHRIKIELSYDAYRRLPQVEIRARSGYYKLSN